MITLKTRGITHNITDTLVARIVSGDNYSNLVCYSPQLKEKVQLIVSNVEKKIVPNIKTVSNIPSLMNLDKNDIVMINPRGFIITLFKDKSLHNSLFITNRCNSNCLMCSQPPKHANDLDFWFDINSQIIAMMPITTKELGITGGEPTLLGRRFITLLDLITNQLPETGIHVLTNGRLFAWKNFPEAISKVKNSKIVFGIPLYSDDFQIHDFIVQAKNAFYQTVLGFHNMARYGLRLELRVVLHKQSYKRLPSLAKYVFMNMPFVEHIAFMGLEYTGYSVRNRELIWIEPSEYSNELEEAVLYLDAVGMSVSIYNLQLCVLKPSLWKFARLSISDWKMRYLDECGNCTLLNKCCGIFSTSNRHSTTIKAIVFSVQYFLLSHKFIVNSILNF